MYISLLSMQICTTSCNQVVNSFHHAEAAISLRCSTRRRWVYCCPGISNRDAATSDSCSSGMALNSLWQAPHRTKVADSWAGAFLEKYITTVQQCLTHTTVFQILFYGKLGVTRVLNSQWGLTRPSSIYFSLSIVRDIVLPVIRVYVVFYDL